jgi:NAD(P)-dependent dehydrogenase (short-subunit alcohol dehydrogenase family)
VGEEEERSGKVVDAILVGRWGKPEDQARAALFLADPENGFITGSELAVDGGSLV